MDEEEQRIPICEWPPEENLQSNTEEDTSLKLSNNVDDVYSRKRTFSGKQCNRESTLARAPLADFVDTVVRNHFSAKVALAKWWKHQCSVSAFQADVPKFPNAAVKLNWIKSLDESEEFLQRCLHSLKDCTKGKITKDLLLCRSSFFDILKEDAAALKDIDEAIQLGATTEEVLLTRERIFRNVKIKMKQESLLQQLDVTSIPVESTGVDCYCGSEMTAEDFHAKYVMRNKPVVFKGLALEMVSQKWSFDFLKKVLGAKKCCLKQSVDMSTNWAKLEDGSNETLIGDFIDGFIDKSTKSDSYLFDWSLPLYAPDLAKSLRLPKYFFNDYLQRTEPGSLYKDSWPSLFVAPAGVVSDLHVDAFASNFWMALFKGRKRWTFFDPDDVYCLYPRYHHSLDAVFDVDLKHPDYERFPLLRMARPQQCILEAGDVLFVPNGSPHFVENLEDSIAISSNFVDISNISSVIRELELDALVNPEAKDLLRQLTSKNLSHQMTFPACNSTWDDYKTQVLKQ